MKFMDKHINKLPAPYRVMASHVIWAALGVAFAVVLHYVLYRIGIPGTPFIYVVF